jgi:uncharacterized alkaline shock family protein YloU
MAKRSDNLGDITISDDVIAEIAGRTTLECYGVVGMGKPSKRSGVTGMLSPERIKRGVKVLHNEGGALTVALYVVVEYGTNLSEVAHNLMTQVKYALEKLAGLAVEAVDVNIQSVNVSR